MNTTTRLYAIAEGLGVKVTDFFPNLTNPASNTAWKIGPTILWWRFH
jgi:hypothetical protein